MPIWPVQQLGSTGEDVTTVQHLVSSHGFAVAADADFGAATVTAVTNFQSANGLVADGIVGDVTWPALLVTVAAGASGPAVNAVQGQLRSQGWRLATDGSFGARTTAAVRDFQTARNLVVDGIVGPQTWFAFVTGFTRLPTPDAAAAHLYDAWGARNRTAALTGATQAAVDLVLRGERGDLTPFGCSPNPVLGPGRFVCSYGYEGGVVNFHTWGDDTNGYYVESATFVAD